MVSVTCETEGNSGQLNRKPLRFCSRRYETERQLAILRSPTTNFRVDASGGGDCSVRFL